MDKFKEYTDSYTFGQIQSMYTQICVDKGMHIYLDKYKEYRDIFGHMHTKPTQIYVDKYKEEKTDICGRE